MKTQQSPEWFAARKGRVTASKVGAILGIDPHRTREDVLRAMVREYHGAESEFTGNIATEYGTAMEEEARAFYELDTGVDVEPAFFERLGGWSGASPDGYLGDDGLIEIKCPYSRRDIDDPSEFLDLKDQPHYFAQMQWQMYVTGRGHCVFYQWAQGAQKLDVVQYDPDYVSEILPELRRFYKDYELAILTPDEHLEPITKTIDTDEARELLDAYDLAQEVAKTANKEANEIKKNLVALTGGKDATVHGRKLTRVVRKGRVAYSRVIKEHLPDLDLEPYRGKSSEHWRLS